MKVMSSYDLPCKLVIVIGHNSGGTSATTGTLIENGFWATKSAAERNKFYEDNQRLRPVFNPRSSERIDFTTWFFYSLPVLCRWYKENAIDAGFNKTAFKCNRLIMDNSLLHRDKEKQHTWRNLVHIKEEAGMDIIPLLVHRDIDSTFNSWSRRFYQGRREQELYTEKEVYDEISKSQNLIVWLHETYGWPMWEFSKDADISKLEECVGEPLPIKHYDPDRVKH